ncbi:MAG: cytochrome c [Xanthobacteraceae bacterium]|jgi:mono/diheme cytochrome c family protein
MNFVRIFVAPAVLAVGAFAAGVIGQGTAFAASAEKGKAAYIQYGCWQCHDFAGEGAVTSNGKVLARTPLPLDAFIAFVRTTNGQMPPYRPPVLSDEDIADMYAYLQSLPQPKSASDIPLLGEVRSQ